MRLSRPARLIGPALLLVGILLVMPVRGWAGSCCGGGGGASLILPKTGRAAASLSAAREQYNGYYDQQGSWHPDPPGSNLAQYRLSLAGFDVKPHDTLA